MNLQGNILILTSWSFKDALVQTYTLPYINIIREILPASYKIIIVTEEQPPIDLSKNELVEINGQLSPKNLLLVPFPYKNFGWKKMVVWLRQLYKLWRLVRKEKITTIHAFCTPAGTIGYILSKLTRIPLIIDSYEPHAESMVENGTWTQNSFAFRLLSRFEKWQTKRAQHLIATAASMKDYAKEKYGVTLQSFFVKPACVDLEKFSLQKKNDLLLKELNLQDKIVGIYAGKLGGIYLKHEVFDFIKACYDHWGDKFRFILLTGNERNEIDEQMRRVGLPPEIVISKFIFHNEVPQYLSLGDFAINPVKPVPSKRYCTSIKDGEYWAMGLPVIISPGISDDSEIIEKEKTGVEMDFGKKESFGNAILRLEELFSNKSGLQRRIRNTAEKYRSFEIAKKIYTQIYSSF